MNSMTGYGKAECKLADKIATIEIKSLNSKQLDIFTRLPSLYKEKEMEIRKIIADSLSRGKIECSVNIEVIENSKAASINITVVKEYFKQICDLSKELNLNSNEPLLHTLLRLPESLKPKKEELVATEWNSIEKHLNLALMNLHKFRDQEGLILEKDILSRIKKIEELLVAVEKYEPNRINSIKLRIDENLQEYIGNDKFDKNRFEQELIYYLEKIDINEEKVRLKNHCDFFKECLNEKSDSLGKKLGFVSQEIGREINTIGSKANDFEMQKLVVLMKDELEKVKEQLMNVL